MKKGSRILCSAVAVLGLALTAIPAFGQTTPQVVEYSAKFVCGTPTSTQIANEQIAAGIYATSINIHNPASNLFTSETSVSFEKKAVLALPEGTTPVPPSAFVQESLENDFAEEVDCKIIRTLLGTSAPPAPAYIEGWVVILVPPTAAGITNVLDVWGVYTNSKGAEALRPATERFFTPGGAVAVKPKETKDRSGS